jgi:SAM-dependent methyltransferase
MPAPLELRTDRGTVLPLDPHRWFQEPTVLEQELLAAIAAPVLDVGCGPGRLVVGLGRLGRPAMGVDPAPGAVALARLRGATVLQRSVFDRLPGGGRWRSLLLLDGNVGIAGDPGRLLRRCRQLIAPGGTIVAEVEPSWSGCVSYRARLERGQRHGPWFPWAVVGSDAIERVAAGAGLELRALNGGDGRCFAHLGQKPAQLGSAHAVA